MDSDDDFRSYVRKLIPDCWLHIFNYLEHHDTYALLRTSRYYYELASIMKVYLDKLYPEPKLKLTEWTSTDSAITNGYLGVVKWLYSKDTSNWTFSIYRAAEYGHLDIIKWLCQVQIEDAPGIEESCEYQDIDTFSLILSKCYSYFALDIAASNGHLEVVKWLHHNDAGGCGVFALNSAAKEGHLEVVKWLCLNRAEDGIQYVINQALDNGHLEIVKWLHDYIGIGGDDLSSHAKR